MNLRLAASEHQQSAESEQRQRGRFGDVFRRTGNHDVIDECRSCSAAGVREGELELGVVGKGVRAFIERVGLGAVVGRIPEPLPGGAAIVRVLGFQPSCSRSITEDVIEADRDLRIALGVQRQGIGQDIVATPPAVEQGVLAGRGIVDYSVAGGPVRNLVSASSWV